MDGPGSSFAAVARAVAAAQVELETRASALAAASGLACPPLCGACCLSPSVETSVAEVAPAAAALFERGDAERVHRRLADAAADARARGEAEGGPCALYVPEPGDPARGRCSVYSARPSICRVFGFGARRARSGAFELATCRELRRADAPAVERAAALVAAGFDAPRIDRDATRIALEHGADARPRPINQALRLALERLGLERALAGVDGGRPLAGDDDGRPRPVTPPRNAA